MRLRICTAALTVAALSVLMLFSWTAAAADGFQEGYELGKQEGKADTPFISTVWGLLGNVFAFSLAAFSTPPDPSAVRMQQLEGKSSDYKTGYLEGYSRSRQVMRLSYIGGGMAVFAIFGAIAILGLIAQNR
jgi:hypothetical protein